MNEKVITAAVPPNYRKVKCCASCNHQRGYAEIPECVKHKWNGGNHEYLCDDYE
jgi:hypothetical protein